MKPVFRHVVTCAAASGLFFACAAAPETKPQSGWIKSNPDWVEAVEPFRIDENIFYVGTRGLSSFLVSTDDGHILVDGGVEENAPIIAANIAALGFDIRDVKYLLNSHAHFDHSGGLAELKRRSGAIMVASQGDRWALENGKVPGSESDPDFAAPPVKVDRVIGDGETLTLGGVTLTARLTPGHTRGCTSWTMTAGGHDVLFFCSASVAANRLVASKAGPPQYEGIVEDYRATFEKMKTSRPDILLANHSNIFGLEERRARQIAGDDQAFVDREAFPALIAVLDAAFEKALAKQTEAAAQE